MSNSCLNYASEIPGFVIRDAAMTLIDPSSQLPAHRPRRRNRIQRLVLLSVITMCGLTMIAILVSQPQVTSQLQLAAQHVSARYNGEARDPAEVLSFSSEEGSGTSTARVTRKYSIDQRARETMPRDRVRVRRSGIVSAD